MANTLSRPREGVFISGPSRHRMIYAMFTTVSQAIHTELGRMW
jgi:hypothetical protein